MRSLDLEVENPTEPENLDAGFCQAGTGGTGTGGQTEQPPCARVCIRIPHLEW
jgi:hypothetical protein